MARQAPALARISRAAYLKGWNLSAGAASIGPCLELRVETLRQIQASEPLPSSRRLPLVAVVGVVIAITLLTAAVWLWASYGTTVFFEMLAAGIAACF